jgi:4-amino-4-deoxy-L-arabinose transferase-like glycosyltransferase
MGKYTRCAMTIIVVAVLLRIVLISQSYPVTNSDESTMGLMALHIAYRGEHPAFFYGQNYMGSLEAYLGAAFFHLFGPSTFSLRLGLIALFTLFLISMYLLTSLLYSRGLALVSLILLCLGADGILRQELWAMGGYPETLLFGALVMLIASWLALSFHRVASQPYPWVRYLLYGCWGLAAGLGLWSDLLVMPFVLMSALLLLVGCWREWRTWALPCLLLGLVIGALPLISYNLTALPGQDSFSILLRIRDTDRNHGLPGVNQVIGAFFVSLPIITGVNPTCPVSGGQHITFAGPHPFLCWLEYTSWGVVFTLLWIIATLLTLAALWKLRARVEAQEQSYEKRQIAMLHFARLALLGSAGLTMLLYAISSNAAYLPQLNDRYLTGVLISFPAVIAPLWFIGRITTRGTRFRLTVRWVAMLLIALAFLSGTLGVFQALPAAQSQDSLQAALAHDLLKVHVKRIYSEYWTCDRIIFQSDEHIICAVIDENAQIATVANRYTPYVTIVQADPRAAYVLPTGSALATAFAGQIAHKGVQYQHFALDGYQIYVPLEQVPSGHGYFLRAKR